MQQFTRMEKGRIILMHFIKQNLFLKTPKATKCSVLRARDCSMYSDPFYIQVITLFFYPFQNFENVRQLSFQLFPYLSARDWSF